MSPPTPRATVVNVIMAQKYIIAVDRAHVRIYRYAQGAGQFTPSIQPVDALDLPHGRKSYTAGESSMAGRFPGSTGRPGGMPIDERLPLQEEQDRRVTAQLAARIAAFLESNLEATWDFAATSSLRDALLDALPDSIRHRLDQIISKDLVNVPPAELREHFTLR